MGLVIGLDWIKLGQETDALGTLQMLLVSESDRENELLRGQITSRVYRMEQNLIITNNNKKENRQMWKSAKLLLAFHMTVKGQL